MLLETKTFFEVRSYNELYVEFNTKSTIGGNEVNFAADYDNIPNKREIDKIKSLLSQDPAHVYVVTKNSTGYNIRVINFTLNVSLDTAANIDRFAVIANETGIHFRGVNTNNSNINFNCEDINTISIQPLSVPDNIKNSEIIFNSLTRSEKLFRITNVLDLNTISRMFYDGLLDSRFDPESPSNEDDYSIVYEYLIEDDRFKTVISNNGFYEGFDLQPIGQDLPGEDLNSDVREKTLKDLIEKIISTKNSDNDKLDKIKSVTSAILNDSHVINFKEKLFNDILNSERGKEFNNKVGGTKILKGIIDIISKKALEDVLSEGEDELTNKIPNAFDGAVIQKLVNHPDYYKSMRLTKDHLVIFIINSNKFLTFPSDGTIEGVKGLFESVKNLLPVGGFIPLNNI